MPIRATHAIGTSGSAERGRVGAERQPASTINATLRVKFRAELIRRGREDTISAEDARERALIQVAKQVERTPDQVREYIKHEAELTKRRGKTTKEE